MGNAVALSLADAPEKRLVANKVESAIRVVSRPPVACRQGRSASAAPHEIDQMRTRHIIIPLGGIM
jgi:hypothetical protein